MRKALTAFVYPALAAAALAAPASAATVLGDGDYSSRYVVGDSVWTHEDGYQYASTTFYAGDEMIKVYDGLPQTSRAISRLDHALFNVLEVSLTAVSRLYFKDVPTAFQNFVFYGVRGGQVVATEIFKTAPGTTDLVWNASSAFSLLDSFVVGVRSPSFAHEITYSPPGTKYWCEEYCSEINIASMKVELANLAPVPLPAAILPFGAVLAGAGAMAVRRRNRA